MVQHMDMPKPWDLDVVYVEGRKTQCPDPKPPTMRPWPPTAVAVEQCCTTWSAGLASR